MYQESRTVTSVTNIYERLPGYIIRDEPKAAVFVSRKLFDDFATIVQVKIESCLSQKSDDKQIFNCLSRKDDRVYDQVLEAIGAISEFCLPSLLRLSLSWYHYQLQDETKSRKRPQSFSENFQSSLSNLDNQNSDCGSPSYGDGSILLASASNSLNLSNNVTMSATLSPTPSSPDISSSQYMSITSPIPNDSQPSASVAQSVDPNNSNTSVVNTSTSTATNASSNSLTDDSNQQPIPSATSSKTNIIDDRKLLIEYASCQIWIEIFSQIHLHPGYDDLVIQVEDIAFDHFGFVDRTNEQNSSNTAHINQLADMYAKVIGVLAHTQFKAIKKRFIDKLNKLKSKEQTQYIIQCIVTLLSGMKYFRVKMAPIEDFERSLQFLQELAEYFLEVRHKSIKHALAGLFVDIMIPLASSVKNEVKIPCLKNLVDTLWNQTLDMCARKKHSLTLFPLVTCLLCLSQRSFFLANWGAFLNMCLSNLKNRDQKMCRVALESLYRLVWIYMIRVKCESNNITQTRLQSIVDAIFPKNSRSIVPRDAPLSIFVDMIHYIAQERLDFAMRHIIFDLLSVERPYKLISAPERMNVAIQAYLVIANGLQHKDGEPPMPKCIATTDPDDIEKNISKFNRFGGGGRMLSDETAKSIGLNPYCGIVQKSFNDILKALDNQFGRPLLLTAPHINSTKEADGVITSDRKPKIELFRTCIAAIPNLLPDGMSKSELVDLLSRMTIHVDETMQRYAFESLRTLVTDFPDWRLDAIEGFTLFLINHIDESMRNLVDNALMMLLQFLISWKGAVAVNSNNVNQYQAGPGGSGSSSNGYTNYSYYGNNNFSVRSNTVNIQTGYETISSRQQGPVGQIAARKSRALAEMRLIQSELSNIPFHKLVSVLQRVEGASLVMMCSCHRTTRKLASYLLRESRSIINSYSAWSRMEQFGFKSADEVDEEDLSSSIKGSMSADNLSRITAISASGPAHSSVTSMNTQAFLANSISKMCIATSSSNQLNSNSAKNNNQGSSNSNNNNNHDLYDTEIENHLTDTFTDDNLVLTFWFAVVLLESEKDQEYMFALRLLKVIIPRLPFELPEFLDELDRNLKAMNWDDFPGIHALILRGCTTEANYDISIILLDMLTPILKNPICSGVRQQQQHLSSSSSSTSTSTSPIGDERTTDIEDKLSSNIELNEANDNLVASIFPIHVMILSTHLLSNYDDPSLFSLNIARRIAIWCEENHFNKKLENLSTVMNLYSRRSFSKDAFQWTKCVVKYLFDVYSNTLAKVITVLVRLLENGPMRIQLLIAPILYCILTYLDLTQEEKYNVNNRDVNRDILRIYTKFLGSDQWRDAIQIFKLIISRSSSLTTSNSNSGHSGRELPGRTMDFTMDIDSMFSIVALTNETFRKTNLEEQQQQQQQDQILDQQQQSLDQQQLHRFCLVRCLRPPEQVGTETRDVTSRI